jgi:hypothetical protein
MTDSITTATSQADASAEVQRVRADLMKGAIHWNEVVAAYDPIKSTGPAAGFVDDLLTNGDCDDLNGDIVIAEQPDGQQKAASHG